MSSDEQKNVGMKKGPIIISPPDRSLKIFFSHLGKVFEVRNENLSKAQSKAAFIKVRNNLYNLLKKFFILNT